METEQKVIQNWYICAMKNLALLLLPFLALPTSAQNLRLEHAPDGNSREFIQSITITSIPHAPFSCTVSAESVKRLEDGGTISIRNHRIVVRDSAGRIFQERRSFVPSTSTKEPQLLQLEISDPISRMKYFCHPLQRTCDLSATLLRQ